MSGINIQQTSSIDQSNASYFFSDKNYAISNPHPPALILTFTFPPSIPPFRSACS